MATTVWLDDLPGGYHNIDRCKCDNHCRNCFDDLDSVRAGRAMLIKSGVYKPGDQLGPREKYCSDYCRNRAKRERALDRALAKVTVRP
jgi:hypothetical protein